MGLTSISLETLVGRDSRPNCLPRKELRRYEPRSRFPQKPPFRAHFRAFYPHPAHKSALRAEVPAHFLAPGKRGLSPPSPLATVLPSHAPRFPPHAVTSGVRSCAAPPPLATACHRPPYCQSPNGARSRRTTPYIHYITEPGDSCGQINLFLPTRRSPTVDHSLVAGGAQRQWLRACLPDGHQPQWPSSVFLSSQQGDILTSDDSDAIDQVIGCCFSG